MTRGNAAEIGEVLERARLVAGFTEIPRLANTSAPPQAEEERHEPSAGNAGAQEPLPAAGAALPTSPAAVAAPRHEPKRCSSCSAGILWAQQLHLDEDESSPTYGKWLRVPRDDGRGWRSMPVDFTPDPLRGNVVIFDRPGEGIVCRVFRDAATARAAFPTANLRTSHFVTCPNARQHRRSR